MNAMNFDYENKEFVMYIKAENQLNYIHFRRSAKESIDSVSVSIVMPL